ncbi:hypothetical protein C8R46DRAFT_581297 [Mycena filopes]|nr:hypothetical protein C8R46DRAFT_1201854 [Mycena filopes]KAJ7141575.1 hypothetical protein C8R46DRAFT_581297 [Mycena filopes]
MSFATDASPLLPLYTSPRPAPSPPSSSGSESTLEGFVYPRIPPPDCPLKITLDPSGHPVLPCVSEHGLPPNNSRCIKLTKTRSEVYPKCANCAELAIPCDFSESGVPCSPCMVLGIPDCVYADPWCFMATLSRERDIYLADERQGLFNAVKDNRLSPSVFEREYQRGLSWWYSIAQGAIDRFLINCSATNGLAFRGYEALAQASTDAGHLLRFLALGHDAHIHPSVLGVVTDRLQALIYTMSN